MSVEQTPAETSGHEGEGATGPDPAAAREALRIADRIQVVRGGTTTKEFGPDASQVDVLAAAAGAVEEVAAS